MLSAKYKRSDLQYVQELFSKGDILANIQGVYDLENTKEAMKILESGHASGKLIIQIA